MASIAQQLRDIASKPSDQRYPAYEGIANKAVSSNDAAAIHTLAQHLVNVEGAEQYGRTYIVPDLLNHLILLLADPEQKLEDPMDVDDLTPLLKQLVDLIRPKADDMPDALMNALELLAQCYQANEEFKSAAYTLSSFKFDDFKNKCSATSEHRAKWHVRTAELFLQVGESGLASQQIKRAHTLMSEVGKLQSVSGVELVLRFKTSYARILDSERKFNEASLRYMELSQSTATSITDAGRMQSLEYAVSCAILSKAGPQRSRVLAMLYSDERSKQLANFGMLEKVFRERIISAAEVSAFEQLLQEHQKADTGSGRTVLQNSTIEHNLLAAARLYVNIHFAQLGVLLGIPTLEAEQLAAGMIEQGRLQATIDQLDGLLHFQQGGDDMAAWDQQIGHMCLAVNKVLEDINRTHPGQYDV